MKSVIETIVKIISFPLVFLFSILFFGLFLIIGTIIWSILFFRFIFYYTISVVQDTIENKPPNQKFVDAAVNITQKFLKMGVQILTMSFQVISSNRVNMVDIKNEFQEGIELTKRHFLMTVMMLISLAAPIYIFIKPWNFIIAVWNSIIKFLESLFSTDKTLLAKTNELFILSVVMSIVGLFMLSIKTTKLNKFLGYIFLILSILINLAFLSTKFRILDFLN
ncbi:MAG: hypothetical protein MI974_29620 [Chitinophagales bacterium]|nr:hypothetical protein [Chitinophagales bacterium]